MNNTDYQERIKEAKERERKRAITLRELLVAMEPSELLPDEWENVDNFLPQSVYKIRLCFMSEEETWIETYRNHVILVPWYDCKVYGFNASGDEFTMDVWLKYEEYIKLLAKRKQEVKP